MSVQLEERVALLEAEVERLKHQLPSILVKTEHPMLKFAGIFKDDPDFAAVVANIAADRAAPTEE
jgi:alanine dehydrogenase